MAASNIKENHPTAKTSDFFAGGDDSLFKGTEEFDLIQTYSGRAAIFQLLTALRISRNLSAGVPQILIPAFHCPTVVEPAIQAGYSVAFYGVGLNLNIRNEDLISKISPSTTVVLVINYFGIRQDIADIVEQCRRTDTVLVEDCAHSFLNAQSLTLTGDRADAAIYSYKKLVPSGVGGGIRINSIDLSLNLYPLKPPWLLQIREFRKLLPELVDNAPDRFVANAIRAVNRIRHRLIKSHLASHNQFDTDEQGLRESYNFDLQMAQYAPPKYAIRLIQHADYIKIAAERRLNFEEYARHFPISKYAYPVFDSLSSSVCPWAFPVFVRGRKSIDNLLRVRGVRLFTFGETLHELFSTNARRSNNSLDDARTLSESILCLSIHQGISTTEIRKSCETIREVIGQ